MFRNFDKVLLLWFHRVQLKQCALGKVRAKLGWWHSPGHQWQLLAGLRDKPCGKGVLCQAGARLCPQWHVPGLQGITALFEHTLEDVNRRGTGEAT